MFVLVFSVNKMHKYLFTGSISILNYMYMENGNKCLEKKILEEIINVQMKETHIIELNYII
jgi:hypothetical protein